MRRFGVLAAAILAACLFLVPAAQAGCTPGEGDCPLEFPESEQVNPDPAGGAGLRAWESVGPGSAAPVVVAMPLPREVPVRAGQGDRPPAPVTPLPVPMRYQDPANSRSVDCGIQALGMALDGLDGAAPTSAALAGFLERAGMLYEYGTGVEELALAAQAHGYTGSLPVHDATLDDLRAQLELGQPVVVALGTSGEGQPGHFVTVTGISADGQWIAYNDPALGPQTVPVGEFEELWARQGNSGVFVARQAPVAPDGEPVDALPWVALMAGVMALVSATPWGSLRPGVGGRVDAGGGGGGKKASPAPSPKSAPKPAPKPAPAPAPRARFDEEPAPAPKPAPPPTPAPAPVKANPPAPKPTPAPVPVVQVPAAVPKARFDEEPDPPARPPASVTPTPTPTPKPTPTPAPTPASPRTRFDDEPDAAPRAPATPTPMPTATRTPTLGAPRARFDEEPGLAAAPRLEADSTNEATRGRGGSLRTDLGIAPQQLAVPVPMPPVPATPIPQLRVTSSLGAGQTPGLPDHLERYFLKASLVEGESRSPLVDLNALEIGEHRSWHAGGEGDSGVRISPTRFSLEIMGATVQGSWEGNAVQIGLQTPRKTFALGEDGAVVEVGQSASFGLRLDGWDTTSSATFSPVDFTVSGGPVYGSGKYGVYVEEKPVQVIALTELAKAAIGAMFFVPGAVPYFEQLMRQGLVPNPIPGG